MADAYGRECLTKVVALICQNQGYNGMQRAACDAMTDVMRKYIENIGKRSRGTAELAGRTECNATDVLNAFRMMGINIEELKKFASLADDITFPETIPKFPIEAPPKREKRKKAPETAAAAPAAPRNIPSFLPPLPEPRTYANSKLYPETHTGSAAKKRLRAEQRRDVESSLTRLTKQFPTSMSTNYDSSIHKDTVTGAAAPPTSTNPNHAGSIYSMPATKGIGTVAPAATQSLRVLVTDASRKRKFDPGDGGESPMAKRQRL